MKKLLIAAAFGATAIGGMAFAAQQAAPPAPATPPVPAASPAAPAPAAAPMRPRVDADGDGVITREEYLAQAAERFDRMDANKDGRIDAAERQQMRSMGRRGGRGMGMGPGMGPGMGMRDAPPPPPDNE